MGGCEEERGAREEIFWFHVLEHGKEGGDILASEFGEDAEGVVGIESVPFYIRYNDDGIHAKFAALRTAWLL